jgi:hypothetical protein
VRSTRTHPIPNPITRGGGTNPKLLPKKPSRMPPPGGLVRAPTEPRGARYVNLVRLVPKCVLHTSRVASPAQDKPVRGGSNPGPKRSGPADGALPVEVHLRSWGRGRAQSGAKVVRSGSYPVSWIVPKKPSRMPLPEAWYELPPNPMTRYVRTSYPSYQSACCALPESRAQPRINP